MVRSRARTPPARLRLVILAFIMTTSLSPLQTHADTHARNYTAKYFSEAASGSKTSAKKILDLVRQLYTFSSVLDVGCGQGAWLSAAEELGATRLVGFDGHWVDRSKLLSPNIDFHAMDLALAFSCREKFDLCMSVEVAEHLPPSRAAGFVQDLCAASDVIVFSAAIRLQGGLLHTNEQWQSYWALLFQAAGFVCHDIFRAQLWNMRTVDCWYRQNTFLYVKHSHLLTEVLRRRPLQSAPLDLVHPEIYENNLETYKKTLEEPTLRACCEMLGRWSKRQISKLWRV
jgi:SAM-dependent methyltransferase